VSKTKDAFIGLVSLAVAVALGLWGSNAGNAQGDSIFFLVYFALFALKIFLDDLSHFSGVEKGIKAAFGFKMSFLMWVALVASFVACVKFNDLRFAVLVMIAVISIGTVWIAKNYIGENDADSESKKRHVTWVVLNCLHIFGLTIYLALIERWSAPEFLAYTPKVIFVLLTIMVVGDMFRFTFKRLSE